MKYDLVAACALLIAARPTAAQTRVDLRTQSKSVDVSGQTTKTSQIGAALPGICAAGESFILTTAAPGKNLYLCIGGAWTAVAGGADLRISVTDQDKVLSNDGTTYQWQAIGGDVGGKAGALQVNGIQGRPVSNAAPADGNTLKWNAALGVWEAGMPTMILGGDAAGSPASLQVTGLKGRPLSNTAPGNGDTMRWQIATGAWEPMPPVDAGPGIALSGSMVSVDDAVVPIYYTGTAAPAIACLSGRDYFVDTANSDFYYCANGAWSKVAKATAGNPVRSFGVTIDGGGTAVSAGNAGYVTAPFACGITGWSLQADQPGSISIDVWKAAHAIPTSANKISGAAPPALSGAQLAQSAAVTGWATAVTPNDVLGFYVTSAATLTRATLLVNCQ